MEKEIAELRAELEQQQLQIAAVHSVSSAFAHIVMQALETNAVASRKQIAESLINSIPPPDSAENLVTGNLLLRFAKTILTHPNAATPKPRPQLRTIDGGKAESTTYPYMGF